MIESHTGGAWLSIVSGFLLFILVLALAYLCTRWIGGRYARRGPKGEIEVLARTALGPDRSLVIVRVTGRVWLLGVTPHSISPIGELDAESFPQEGPAAGESPFPDALQEALKKWAPGKKGGTGDE